MLRRTRWYISAAALAGLALTASVWLKSRGQGGEQGVSPHASVPATSASGASKKQVNAGRHPTMAAAPSSARVASSGAHPLGTAMLAQALQPADDFDEPVSPNWLRPKQPASTKWAQDPRVVALNEKVKLELRDIDRSFQQLPALSNWAEIGPERIKHAETYAAKLGQRVVGGECRVGMCRLEVEHDLTVKKRSRVRPEPRIRRHPDGSAMVRLAENGSIRTIFFLADLPAASR